MHIKNHVLLNKELIAHILPMSSTEVKVFISILILANSQTGKLTIPLKGLAARVGLSYRMVNRAVLRLKEMGHIRYFSDCRSKESHFEVINYVPRTEENAVEGQTLPSAESSSQCHPETGRVPTNEHSSDQGTDGASGSSSSFPSTANIVQVKPETRVLLSGPGAQEKKLLIGRIVEAFGDQQKKGFYESFCEKVDVPTIKRAFAEVCKVPPDRIKHSKRALFVYLIQKYAGEKR